MSILRSGFAVFLTRLWGAAVGVTISIIIARYFGVEGKGIYSLLLLVPTLLVTLGNAGLQISNVYFYGKKKGSVKDLAANSIWTAFVLGLGIFGLFALIYPFVASSIFSGVPVAFLYVMVATVPLMLLNAYFGNLLLATKKISLFNIMVVTQLTIQLLTVLALVLLLKASLVAAVIAFVLHAIIGVVLSVLFLRRSEKLGFKIQWSLLKDTLRYGIKGYLANVIQFLNYRLDLLLVSFFLGTGAVGWYSVAVNFAEVLWYIPTSLGTILFPHVASSSEFAANRITSRLNRQTLIMMVVSTGALAVISPWLIPLFFGDAFEPSINALLILLPGVLLLSLAKIIGNDFSGRGLVLTNTIVSGIALATNATLNVILIPRVGINGAALASAITYSLATVILIGLFSKRSKMHWTRLVIPEKGDLKELFQFFKRKKV